MAVSAVMSHGLKTETEQHDEIVEGVARSVSSWSCIRYEFIARKCTAVPGQGCFRKQAKGSCSYPALTVD
jgi:hypothetical protein